MRKTLARFKPDLLILDSLTRMHSAEENSASEMSRITSALMSFSREFSVAVVAIHHVTKNGDDRSIAHRLRGSSDIAAAARHIVLVEKASADTSTISTDGNTAFQSAPITVRFKDGEDESGNNIVTIALEDEAVAASDPEVEKAILDRLSNARLTSRELRKAVGVKGERVTRATHRLQQRGSIGRGDDGRLGLEGSGACPVSRPQGRDTGHASLSSSETGGKLGTHEGNARTPLASAASGSGEPQGRGSDEQEAIGRA